MTSKYKTYATVSQAHVSFADGGVCFLIIRGLIHIVKMGNLQSLIKLTLMGHRANRLCSRSGPLGHVAEVGDYYTVA